MLIFYPLKKKKKKMTIKELTMSSRFLTILILDAGTQIKFITKIMYFYELMIY